MLLSLNSETLTTLKFDLINELPKPKKNLNALDSAVVKSRTFQRYVQNKFNLLIEETEGYAKIITELGLSHFFSFFFLFCALVGVAKHRKVCDYCIVTHEKKKNK